MVHNPFPDPAAVLPGEAEMLSAVLADLTDDLPKLVYADWLEEQNDPRGPFLRAFTTAVRSGGKLPDHSGFSKAWLDLTGCRAIAVKQRLGIPMSLEVLLRDTAPAVTFTSKPAPDATLGVGESKFGGDPDLPADFVWPEYNGHPLSFLAQFNLKELSASFVCRELPAVGTLAVFYHRDGGVYSEDVGGWQVYHFADFRSLTPRDSPVGGNVSDWSRPCRLTFTEVLTISDDRFEADFFTYDFHQDVCGDSGHLLFGQPRWIQDAPSWYANHTTRKPKCHHLLTLTSDENPGWMWGDCGSLYFCISADDLKAGRFDRTQFDMQCC